MPKIHPPAPGDDNANPEPERSMLEWALYWAEEGWPVFPLRPNDKIPLFPNPHKGQTDDDGKAVKCQGQCGLVGHGVLDATRDPDKIRKWWSQNPTAGIGGSALGRLIFDFDFEKGAEVKPGVFPTTRVHLSGRENGNNHLVYRPGGPAAMAIVPQTSRSLGLGNGVDVRAGSGSYVVLPPSRHPETKRPYTVSGNAPEHELTDDEVEAIWAAYGAKEPAAVKGARKGLTVVTKNPGGGGRGRKLSELLENPPERGAGQTNDWLTEVAGHYAKMHRDKRDLYEVEVRRAAAMVDPDYEETEKVLESIWGKESAEHPERDARMEGGFLVGTGRHLLVQGMVGSGDERKYELIPWANFDLRADGVMVDEDNHRSYQVTITCLGRETETTLAPDTIADSRKLATWLARFGAVVMGTEAAYPKLNTTTRLQLYLESQRPPEARVVQHLGWDKQSAQFITLDGAITANDARSIREAGVIANRDKVNHKTAKYHYGFDGSWEEAQEVLREVQGYHFEDVVHLHGAWWAGVLLKPQAMEHCSLFPFYAAEAGSGSAKTNGYFAKMVQLNGGYAGTVVATKASFRDSAAVHTNGILWADDMDDPTNLQEIVRAATSGGTMRKMGEDRVQADFTLLNPLLFTGEALMLDNQKALLERGVLAHPASPTQRTSLKPGREGLSQWQDITDLQNRYPGPKGLSVLSGWYVQEALKVQGEFVAALKARLSEVPGRRGEKYAILQAGARLMDHLLGEEGAWDGRGQTARWVDAWAAEELRTSAGVENDNSLTIKLIPWAIRNWGPIEAEAAHTVDYRGSREQAPPVLVVPAPEDSLDEPEIWVNTTLLAKAWHESEGGRVNGRLETEAGMQMQIQQLAYPRKEVQMNKRFKGAQFNYRKLLPGYASLIMSRVEG